MPKQSTSSSTSASSASSTKSQLAAALVAAHASSKRSPGGEARFVSVLCSDFGVNREELARAVEAWRASSSTAGAAAPRASSSTSSPSLPGDDASAAAAEERLRRASTPSYESFWPAVAGVPGGLGTLAELRAAALEDVARGGGGGRKEHSGSSSSPSPRRRAALAASLARSLAPALASGTSLVRIGAAAAAAAAATGGKGEENEGRGGGGGIDGGGLPLLSRAASAAQAALHPVRSPGDWRARLAPPRACFALLHERGFGRGVPLATVACFSGAEVARRVSEVLPPPPPRRAEEVDEEEEEEEEEEQEQEKRSGGDDARGGGPSATLYALCSAHAGLSGLDVGRAAARGAVEALARGGGGEGGLSSSLLPAATRIATLSPLPGFLPWLRASSSSSSSARKLEFRREEVEAIREAAAAKERGRRRGGNDEEGALLLLLSALEGGDGGSGGGDGSRPPLPPELLRPVLLRLAARFLALETVRRLPLDPVARFHAANGAALARLCWRADDGVPATSPPLCPRRARRVREESAGIMVNYAYLWPRGEEPLALRQSSGAGGARMRVSEGVARLIAGEGEGLGGGAGTGEPGRWGLVD